MRELVHETFEHIEALFQNKGETAGVRTGFKELDGTRLLNFRKSTCMLL